MLQSRLSYGCGEVREWSNRHAWKACVSAMGPWVRIPPSPPYSKPVRELPNVHRETATVRDRAGWESNRGIVGDASPAWGAYEGAGPLVGARAKHLGATSNTHPLRHTGSVECWVLSPEFLQARTTALFLHALSTHPLTQHPGLKKGAGPCATRPCEPRQVRKEATVSGQFCVPQDHLAPLPC